MIAVTKEYSSHDTIEALKMLLSMAEAGKLRGMYFVAYGKRRQQFWGATGVAYEDPTSALGPAVLPVMEMVFRAMGKNGNNA